MADIWDIEPPDVSDLIPERIEVADEDNAYTYLKLMADSIYFPDDELYEEKGLDLHQQISDLLAGKLRDDNLVNDLLNKNKKSFSFLDKSLACKCYQAPPFDSPSDDMGLSSFKIRELWDLINLSFLTAVYNDDFVKAQQIMKTSSQLSQLMANSRDSMAIIFPTFRFALVHNLIDNEKISIKFMRLVLDALPDSIFYDTLLRNDAKACLEAYMIFIEKLASGEESLDKIDLFSDERGGFEKIFRDTTAQVNFLLHKNRTKGILADLYREAIDEIDLPYSKQNLKKRYKSIPECDEDYNIDGISNIIGKYLCLGLQSVYIDLFWKFKCQTELEGLRLSVACKLYKRENGTYPDLLEELLPKYLDKVPNDPFDGKPMRYDSERKIIYSVGKDLIDSGGLTGKEVRRKRGSRAKDIKGDLVFYLEGPPEKK